MFGAAKDFEIDLQVALETLVLGIYQTLEDLRKRYPEAPLLPEDRDVGQPTIHPQGSA